MERRNSHHIFWERRDYRSKPFNALRQLVVAKNVLIVQHDELHANLDPPEKPSRPLVWNILNHLEEHDYRQPLDNVFATMDYLQQVGNPETLVLADHIQQQLGYIAGGCYE